MESPLQKLIQCLLQAMRRVRERRTCDDASWQLNLSFDSFHHGHEENSFCTNIPGGRAGWRLYARDRLDHVLACSKTTNIYIIGSNGIQMSTSYPHQGQNRACLQVWHILAVWRQMNMIFRLFLPQLWIFKWAISQDWINSGSNKVLNQK